MDIDDDARTLEEPRVVHDPPHAQIYISDTLGHQEAQEGKKRSMVHQGETIHFMFVHTGAEHYTPEVIEQCDGAYHCFHCTRSIAGRIYFLPLRRNRDGSFLCSPLAYCRPECLLRTALEMDNNARILTSILMMYGELNPSHPRSMLNMFNPGGMTLDAFHQSVDKNVWITPESQEIRTFFAPTVTSHTVLENYRLLAEVVEANDAAEVKERRSAVTADPEARTGSTGVRIAVEPRRLDQTGIEEVFEPDPVSYQDGRTNPFVSQKRFKSGKEIRPDKKT